MVSLLITCRADPTTGFGHLMRSREIARTAKQSGDVCYLAGPSADYRNATDDALFATWLPIENSSGPDAGTWLRRIDEMASGNGIDHIIIDDYRVDGQQQMSLHQSGYRLLQQYDASAPPQFAVDLAVNASPAEHAGLHYGRRLREGVRFLNGPRYCVVKAGFRNVAKRANGRPVERVLVTFGGGDDRGGIVLVLKALGYALSSGVVLVVMTAAYNPHLADIRQVAAQLGPERCELNVSPPTVPELIASCDLAIMAGGTSVYEAAFCGLPMVLLSIENNQISQCIGMEKSGAARYLGSLGGMSALDLAKTVNALIGNDSEREAMARQGRALVDGKGARRLLDALLERESGAIS